MTYIVQYVLFVFQLLPGLFSKVSPNEIILHFILYMLCMHMCARTQTHTLTRDAIHITLNKVKQY